MEAIKQTGTEVLVRAMEDFGVSEPRAVVVLYTNEDDDVVCHTNVKRVEAVGLLEVAKDLVLRKYQNAD
jgi:hypothetical protein